MLIDPERGRTLIFAHNIMHEGVQVTSGVKYTIRTDIEYASPSLSGLLQMAVGFGKSPAENRYRARQLAYLALVAFPVLWSILHASWLRDIC